MSENVKTENAAIERTRRSGRKRQTGSNRSQNNLNQLPWQQIHSPYAPLKVISDNLVEDIQNAAFEILEDIGIDILHEDAKAIFKDAGAAVEQGSDRVKIGRDIIKQALKTAPSSYTLHARNPLHNLDVSQGSINIGSVASAPNVSDIEKGRRAGNHQDYQNLLKLCQSLNIIHFIAGYPVEPVDLPSRTRHLNCIADMALMTDKFYHAYSLGRERIADA
ncbi:MAG: trimethylamine methyltransferase family protein, partial [Alphaproteobacteria bacterium]|nr:trimethylamine methyltransferase family protein [Alphaproteobacteria bacterium]